MIEVYRCGDGHIYQRNFAEIMTHPHESCCVYVPDPVLNGKPGPMILCGLSVELVETKVGGSFAEAYTNLFLRN